MHQEVQKLQEQLREQGQAGRTNGLVRSRRGCYSLGGKCKRRFVAKGERSQGWRNQNKAMQRSPLCVST
jgi:hypothetical protein